MSLKDNVNAIKEELNAEEQFLESVIKAEGFWKKYKTFIVAIAVIALVAVLAKAVMGYMHEQNILASNEAYATLSKNANDTQALETLKSKNPKMYEMYLFERGTKSTDVASLKALQGEIKDPILASLLSYQIASLEKNISSMSVDVAKEYALLQEAYLLLQNDKIKDAQAKLSQIAADSSLRAVVDNLKHYMGK